MRYEGRNEQGRDRMPAGRAARAGARAPGMSEATAGRGAEASVSPAGSGDSAIDTRRIQEAFNLLNASETTYEKVMDMTRNETSRKSADAKLRTHRMTRRAFVTCAALSVAAVGGAAYAAVETDFFKTAFGDKGIDDLEARDVTDEVTGSTYTLPGTQWVSTDSEEARRLIGDSVERVDESVGYDGYTLTVGSCVVDENGLGIADFTLENPGGLDLYEPVAQEYGELYMNEGVPIGGIRVTDATGEKIADSRAIINRNASTETSIAGACYFDVARANGMSVEDGVGWSLSSCPNGEVISDVISFFPAKYAPAKLFTCDDGIATASLSAFGIVFNQLGDADSESNESKDGQKEETRTAYPEWVISKVVIAYADGSEYVAQDDGTYNIIFGLLSDDWGSQSLLFNRLVDPESVASITVNGLHLGDPDIVLVP